MMDVVYCTYCREYHPFTRLGPAGEREYEIEECGAIYARLTSANVNIEDNAL